MRKEETLPYLITGLRREMGRYDELISGDLSGFDLVITMDIFQMTGMSGFREWFKNEVQ